MLKRNRIFFKQGAKRGKRKLNQTTHPENRGGQRLQCTCTSREYHGTQAVHCRGNEGYE